MWEAPEEDAQICMHTGDEFELLASADYLLIGEDLAILASKSRVANGDCTDMCVLEIEI